MTKYAVMIIMAIAVGISALPQRYLHVVVTSDSNNINGDAVIEIINEGIEKIKEAGLDPYINEGEEYGVKLDLPFLGSLHIDGSFKNFKFTGLSDIVVNRITQEQQRLYLDLALPRLEAVMEQAITEVSYEGDIYGKVEYSGTLAINDIHFIAEVHPSFLGPTLEDLDIDVNIGSIESNLKVIVGETDVSSYFNKFLEFGLLELLNKHEEELNENLSKLVLALIGRRK